MSITCTSYIKPIVGVKDLNSTSNIKEGKSYKLSLAILLIPKYFICHEIYICPKCEHKPELTYAYVLL